MLEEVVSINGDTKLKNVHSQAGRPKKETSVLIVYS